LLFSHVHRFLKADRVFQGLVRFFINLSITSRHSLAASADEGRVGGLALLSEVLDVRVTFHILDGALFELFSLQGFIGLLSESEYL